MGDRGGWGPGAPPGGWGGPPRTQAQQVTKEYVCKVWKVQHGYLSSLLQVRFADQEQDGGASHVGPGGMMGGQGGPQAYSQEPIYTPRILRDPGEPVNRPSQPHVQFDMGGVRKTGKLCDREFMNSRRCNISHLICHQTQALQANQEHLNEDHLNHLQHHHQEALIRYHHKFSQSYLTNLSWFFSQGTPTRSTGGRDALPPPPPPPTNESSHPGHPGKIWPPFDPLGNCRVLLKIFPRYERGVISGLGQGVEPTRATSLTNTHAGKTFKKKNLQSILKYQSVTTLNCENSLLFKSMHFLISCIPGARPPSSTTSCSWGSSTLASSSSASGIKSPHYRLLWWIILGRLLRSLILYIQCQKFRLVLLPRPHHHHLHHPRRKMVS